MNSAREFFLATFALDLLIGGRFSVKQLCDEAPLLKKLFTNTIEIENESQSLRLNVWTKNT